jgi:gas vesicle protein
MKHAGECHGQLYIYKETWIGLQSKLHICCDLCSTTSKISTDSKDQSLPINQAAVWGTMAGGGGYQSLFDTMKIMDIPPMMFRNYKLNELKIHDYQQYGLLETIKLNGKEELEIAQRDPLTSYHDGIPCVAVTCDGGWGKRSYGHSFKSLSGCAVIIGNKTGKILWLGIRNKYCFKCDLHGKALAISGTQCTVGPSHSGLCWKNYTGTSTSMETDIIKEGFLKSKETHGLFYNAMLGDQDSSCYPSVKESMDQRFGLHIRKIHCVNHAVRNVTSSLYKIIKATKTYSLSSRKFLEKNISRVAVSIKAAISYNKEDNQSNLKTLMNDILNVPCHIAGDHGKCRDYFCRRKEEVPNEVISDREFWKDFQVPFKRLSDLSDSLIENMRSNKAENFMSVVSKFIAGKRKNLYLGNQYLTRVLMAGNSHKKSYQADKCNYKTIFGKSPNGIWGKKSLIGVHTQIWANCTLFPTEPCNDYNFVFYRDDQK